MDLICSIRKKRTRFRYSSYKGVIGSTFDNIIKRDFSAKYPWEKMGTDVTEFRNRWGKVYFAPVYDFCSKEIVAWSISRSPNMQQQIDMLEMLRQVKPPDATPILQSDMGWQYQHKDYVDRLEEMGIVQSMSRKGNCLDNACTEGLFGHLKVEFYKGQKWESFEEFKEGLEKYIRYWNTQRRQVKLDGLTPSEFGALKMAERAELKTRKTDEGNSLANASDLADLKNDGLLDSLTSAERIVAENNNGAGKSAPRRKLRIVKKAA